MNAISYLNGDVEITDMPPCTHKALARVAQILNDTICTHRKNEILCSDCASIMWGYEPLLRGTSGPEDQLESKRLSVHLAVTAARYALPIFEGEYPGDNRPRLAIEATEKWLGNPNAANAAYAANAANAAANAANAAANAAAYAANAAANAATNAAANAANAAANAATYAAAYAANAAANAANAAAYAAAYAANAAANAAAYAANAAAYAATYAANAANARGLLDLLIDAYYLWTGQARPIIPEDWQEVRAALVVAGAI
jgi:hypothetical protein